VTNVTFMTWTDATFIAMKVLRKGPLVLLVTADWRQDKVLGSEENESMKSELLEFTED